MSISNKFYNSTPHVINVYTENDTVKVDARTINLIPGDQVTPVAQIQPSGDALSVHYESSREEIDGVSFFIKSISQIDPIPDTDALYIIVSVVYLSAARQAGLDTSKLVLVSGPIRDTEGRVIGCVGFEKA